VKLTREVEGEVFAIALEKPPHAAALGPHHVWISDAKGWRSEALPDPLMKQPAPRLSLFYGRDYRVRVVGTRFTNDTAEGLYFRWLPGGLRVERAEIGRLGTPAGALVAVLGTADPEIVCRPAEVCLVKSRRGWQTIKAPERMEHVTLGDGVGWAVAGTSLLRLGAAGWEPVGPPGDWQSADGLFATRDVVWVIESGTHRLHTFDGARFVVSPSPVEGPRALWGARAEALWLVGDGGLAHFDGRRWLRATDAPGPLAAVAGRGADEVWVGGQRGLFRVVRGR